MTRGEAEAILTNAGEASDRAFPLFEAAIACAVHEDPGRDPEPARVLAAEGAEWLKSRLAKEPAEEALAEAMAGDLRLAGDLMTYDHPDNADVLAVAERRRGIPVALGLFYIDSGRR
ncbi:MAG: transglutaminase family protein, partial [Caulobacteraceae bacterium]